jgi:hypothetical protein
LDSEEEDYDEEEDDDDEDGSHVVSQHPLSRMEGEG